MPSENGTSHISHGYLSKFAFHEIEFDKIESTSSILLKNHEKNPDAQYMVYEFTSIYPP